jgi:hypothetical protein
MIPLILFLSSMLAYATGRPIIGTTILVVSFFAALAAAP